LDKTTQTYLPQLVQHEAELATCRQLAPEGLETFYLPGLRANKKYFPLRSQRLGGDNFIGGHNEQKHNF